MRLLLDTHRLGPDAGGPAHPPVFSVASLWELVIKQALGRPEFTVQPPLLRRALLDGGWQELSIEAHHALAALPPLHRVRLTGCSSPRQARRVCC